MKNNSRHRLYDQQGLNQSHAWGKEKSRKQTGKILRFLVLAFLAVLILTLAVQLPSLLTKLQKPFPSLQSKYAEYGNVNIDHRTNILLVNETDSKVKELGFVSLEKGDRKVKLFKIDPNSKINTLSSAKSFSDLAFEDGKFNIDHLEVSLVATIGYCFDGYVVVEDNVAFINQGFFENLINDFYSPGFLFSLSKKKDYLDKHIKTNLSFNKANSLVWFSKSLSPERVSFVDLTASKDSSGFFDLEDAASKIGLLLADSAISNSETAATVENASSISGVGNIVGNVISNLGGNVLSVTSATSEAAKTTLLVKNKNNPLTKRLETFLNVKAQQAKKSDTFEGDIKLSIGDDYAQFFNF